MPVFALLPLIVIGIVIAVARNAAATKQREAQARAARERQNAAPVPPLQQTPTPVRPSVRIPTPAQEGPRSEERVRLEARVQPKPAQKAQKMHADHDFCALRPDDPKAQNGGHPEHDDCALRPEERKGSASAAAITGGTPLSLEPDDIVRGVLFSEILGKPKALR